MTTEPKPERKQPVAIPGRGLLRRLWRRKPDEPKPVPDRKGQIRWQRW